ncbi:MULTISPECIES: glutaredoxin [unclassified Pseudomonas]|uniref:glutaredoxin n=1 Tax=unclassified Pseudomonas TaxID=196821 RepID=UPI0021BB24BE|nr:MULTISPECIES: glutaredoxin [unclassified Pseudomonas]MCT8166816.1 glutaredoxin [Pseudomonas sp. HD6422]MCT8185712.1 glutaredoxin [Pseudomonas sp. HD6421]
MAEKEAVLYRMVMPEHVCPFGLKSKYLLTQAGYEVEDNWLRTREETDRFKEREGVKSTPQIWIDHQRIGGYDDLRQHLGKGSAQANRYRPVVTVFLCALLLAGVLALMGVGQFGLAWLVQGFFAITMLLLAMLKLQDVESFSNMFLGYDLLAQRWVPYAYVYPYGEALAGLLMVAGWLSWLSGPLAMVLGGVGAISVFRAVYIEKRELKCACVGGSSNVPLGAISLTENLIMFGMGLWMLLRYVA